MPGNMRIVMEARLFNPHKQKPKFWTVGMPWDCKGLRLCTTLGWSVSYLGTNLSG